MPIPRDRVYEFIRMLLNEYAGRLRSDDLEIFAYEMEPPPSGKGSIDPALRHEFEKIAPEMIRDLRSAYNIAAEFIQSEVVALRHIPEAERVVADLYAACQADASPPASVRRAVKSVGLVPE